MMTLLKQQQTNSMHHPPTSSSSYQPQLTLTLVNNEVVAVSKPQQGSQYLAQSSPHARMYSNFQIPVSGTFESVPGCFILSLLEPVQ